MLAAFVVTLLGGLAVKYGLHRFVGGALLNAWFLMFTLVGVGIGVLVMLLGNLLQRRGSEGTTQPG